MKWGGRRKKKEGMNEKREKERVMGIESLVNDKKITSNRDFVPASNGGNGGIIGDGESCGGGGVEMRQAAGGRKRETRNLGHSSGSVSDVRGT